MFRRSWCMVFILFVFATAAAEESKTDKKKNPIKFPTKTAKLIVEVTDEAGEPIQGVVIKPYGCRSVEEPSTGWFWPTYNIGHPKEHTGDVDGKVTVDYPVTFGHEPDWHTCCEISATVTHPEFISQNLIVDPRGGKTQLTMKAGCQLTISAADPNGQTVPFGILIAGPGRSAKWLIDDDGVHKSRAIPDGSWQTMLVSPSDDGRHLFSPVLPVRLRDQQDVNIRNLRLKHGLHLRGRLDDSVPRPVKNGKVVAHCLPKPAGYVYGGGPDDEPPSVSWETAVEIDEDGTFEFPSLPRSGLLQLITLCDGHVGKDKDVIGAHGSHRLGVFLQVADIDKSSPLEIEMEPTGSVQVTVLDDNGDPLSDAYVSTNPNHSMHLAGCTILGHCSETVSAIRAQIDPNFKMDPFELKNPRYSARTNAQGIATINNLPLNETYSFSTGHEKFVMKTNAGRQGRRSRVAIDNDNPTKEITIQLISIESAKVLKQADNVKEALDKVGDQLFELFR